jgi:predicted nucleic acid-binding Zn ribbon protein
MKTVTLSEQVASLLAAIQDGHGGMIDAEYQVIPDCNNLVTVKVCPVCGRAADHDWMTCAEADAQESRADREDRAAILDWIR